MKKLFLLVVLAIFILGCGQKGYVCPDGSKTTDPANCVPAAEQMLEDIEKLADDLNDMKDVKEIEDTANQVNEEDLPTELTEMQKAELDKIMINKQSAVYPTSLNPEDYLKEGDAYTFAYALQNKGAKDAEFQYSITLMDSKSESFSNLKADDTTVSWFKNDFSRTYILSKDEIVYIPLNFVVGDIINKEGDPTKAGTYTFRIFSETIDGPFTRDYHYTDFTVRIK